MERALIQERTKDGLRAAKKRGRVGGNPGLKARDPQAVRRVAESRRQNYFDQLNRSAEHWLPIVREMRPEHRWDDVARVLNSKTAPGQSRWSVEKLKRATKHFVAEGLAEPGLLSPARRRPANDRLVSLVAGIARANPELTLAQIGAQLEAMYERTPRGGSRWAPSSVKNLLGRAEKLGLI